MFILTVRNDRLGDLILALPTVTALRRRFPDARLGLVVSQAAGGVLDLYPHPVDRWMDSPESLARLRSDPPDKVLFLFPDRRWARAARNAGVEERIGTAFRFHSWTFNRRVRVHRRANTQHEAELNLRVAAPLVGAVPLVPPVLEIAPELAARARALMDEVITPGPTSHMVVVHPGSSGSAWNWPPDLYAEVVRLLAGSGLSVIVTGGPQEVETARRVAGTDGCSIAGKTDIGLLGAVLAQAGACVAGSTGPMHLAAAVGCPVVALFSPDPAHSPRRWGPLGQVHHVLVPEWSGRPGQRPPESQAGELMRRLSPEQVARAVLDTVAAGATR